MEFKEFKVEDVFTVLPVKRLTEKGKPYISDKQIITEDGTVPYIAAISTNNGITGYSNRPANNKGDCITLSTTAASPNTVFYQPNDFIGRQQMSAIRRKDGKSLGQECGLYLVAIFRKITQGFNYSNKLTNNYLRNATISLPVHTVTVPDFDALIDAIGGPVCLILTLPVGNHSVLAILFHHINIRSIRVNLQVKEIYHLSQASLPIV